MQLEKVVDQVLIVDLVLMFNTSHVNSRGQVVTSRAAIARKFARGWFLPVLVSSLPVRSLLDSYPRHFEGHRWVCIAADIILRLPRLVLVCKSTRVAWTRSHEIKHSRLVTWLVYSRYSHLARITGIIALILLLAHYVACFLQTFASKPQLLTGDDQLSKDPFAQYVLNLYNALELLQGQGIATTSASQTVFATVVVLLGSIVLAIVFGHVTMLVSDFNANSTSYQRKMESVFAVMNKLQLPKSLRERVHQYYEHLWREYESLDGEIVAFSKGLSHTLELEVVLFKYMDLMLHIPFWNATSPDFLKQLSLHLHVRVHLPDDFIIRRGEVGDEFFMINGGVCELVLGPNNFESTTDPLDDGIDTKHRLASTSTSNATHRVFPRGSKSTTVKLLRRGQSFGELALLMNYERTGNVRALTHVEMCVLKRGDVQLLFVKHPKDRKKVMASILTRAMEQDAKLCGNNSMGFPTPSVVAPHAALLIDAAIHVDKDDPSIKFGIGESLKRKLSLSKPVGTA